MKYNYQNTPIPQGQRKTLNEKVLYLIDGGAGRSAGGGNAAGYQPRRQNLCVS